MDASLFVAHVPNLKKNIESSEELRNFIYINSLKVLGIRHFVDIKNKNVIVEFPQ
jgi:hypothetical protein